MPIPAQRIIKPTTVRNFGRFGDAVEVPPLTDVQTESYKKFLQLEARSFRASPSVLELLALTEPGILGKACL